MTRVRTFAVAVLLLSFATAAHASWYDDYDAGLAAARAGNWNVVVQKMTAAIKGNASENNKARTYGAIFINYHPYYYRGVAYLNLGKYEQAVSDFERATGPGPENLGSIETLMGRAKKSLEASNVPEPDPAPARPVETRPNVVTPPPVPVQTAPSIDPALRQRAQAAIASTKQKLTQAQQRRATASPQYTNAMSIFTEATTRSATARSNDDLNAIITMAENAGDLADLAAAPSVAATPNVPPPVTSAPVIPRSTAATDAVLDDYKRQLRRALESYFAGDFEDATRDFETLVRKLPDNAWIWAFLGASQYSQYAFEADESYRSAALRSFKKAKSLRSWKEGLPEKYFSRRIRRAFRDTAG
ncbi:MAG TPA: tetratricopeptide repeat protein [Thermoanaerobaculia bacterium]|jgi:tetratricopeptide (TPR) repeat protein